jgi:hypothetical protein
LSSAASFTFSAVQPRPPIPLAAVVDEQTARPPGNCRVVETDLPEGKKELVLIVFIQLDGDGVAPSRGSPIVVRERSFSALTIRDWFISRVFMITPS